MVFTFLGGVPSGGLHLLYTTIDVAMSGGSKIYTTINRYPRLTSAMDINTIETIGDGCQW